MFSFEFSKNVQEEKQGKSESDEKQYFSDFFSTFRRSLTFFFSSSISSRFLHLPVMRQRPRVETPATPHSVPSERFLSSGGKGSENDTSPRSPLDEVGEATTKMSTSMPLTSSSPQQMSITNFGSPVSPTASSPAYFASYAMSESPPSYPAGSWGYEGEYRELVK